MLTTISAWGSPMARSVAAAAFCGLTEKAVLAVRPVLGCPAFPGQVICG
jgi:hypothetical protein